VDGLLKIALRLADRLGPTQAAIVLVLAVVGLIAVPLATVAGALPYFAIIVAVAAAVVAGLLILARLDGTIPGGLDEEGRAAVRAVLLAARDDVARFLGSPKDRCRANVVAENRLGRLQINKDLMVNMEEVAEWEISMKPGKGCSGAAWCAEQPRVGIHPFDDDDGLEPDQQRFVDPDLRWIVSVPIVVDGRPKWVVNIDGEDGRTREEVEAAIPTLMNHVPPLKQNAAKA
jgi:hypothetical protein